MKLSVYILSIKLLALIKSNIFELMIFSQDALGVISLFISLVIISILNKKKTETTINCLSSFFLA